MLCVDVPRNAKRHVAVGGSTSIKVDLRKIMMRIRDRVTTARYPHTSLEKLLTDEIKIKVSSYSIHTEFEVVLLS